MLESMHKNKGFVNFISHVVLFSFSRGKIMAPHGPHYVAAFKGYMARLCFINRSIIGCLIIILSTFRLLYLPYKPIGLSKFDSVGMGLGWSCLFNEDNWVTCIGIILI